MRLSKHQSIGIIIFLTAISSILPAEAQTSHLTVTADPTTLKAGYNTTVTFTVANNYEPIYDLDISITLIPSPTALSAPVLIGPNRWRYDKLAKGGGIEFAVNLYVPSGMAGEGFNANVILIYKRLGYISPYTESQQIGFTTKGTIQLVLYDFLIEPSPAPAGSTISITANILNKGNTPAHFTNASLLLSPVIYATPRSTSYIGQIDPNSPTPFTLEAYIPPGIEEGNYTINIQIVYEDAQSNLYSFTEQATFSVAELATTTPKSPRQRALEIVDQYLTILIAITLIILIVAVAAAIRKRRAEKEFEEG